MNQDQSRGHMALSVLFVVATGLCLAAAARPSRWLRAGGERFGDVLTILSGHIALIAFFLAGCAVFAMLYSLKPVFDTELHLFREQSHTPYEQFLDKGPLMALFLACVAQGAALVLAYLSSTTAVDVPSSTTINTRLLAYLVDETYRNAAIGASTVALCSILLACLALSLLIHRLVASQNEED